MIQLADALSTIIFQELRVKYPDIDWTLGSTVRELVAEPVAALGDMADQYIAAAEKRLDILNMVNNPVEYEDVINDLATKLGIVSPDSLNATGTIRILMDSTPELLVIARGTQFTWGSVRLTATEETRWGYGPTLPDNAQSLRMIGPKSYLAEVTVTSNESGELALASGAPVNWMNAPRYVYDCRVGSAITGGRMSYTLAEKAEMIRDIMFPGSYNGEAGIKTALRRTMPLVVRDVVVGEKPSNHPGTVTLFIQTGRAPEQWSTQAIAKKVDGKIVLQSRLPGVYHIVEVYNIETGANASYDVSFDSSDCTITIRKDGVENAPYMIVCEGLKDYAEVQTKLYAESKNTPYDFVVGTPVIATVSLDLMLSSSREITATSPVIVALQRYITSLPINTYLIDDVAVEKVLSSYGISLAAPTIYTADIVSTTEKRKRVSAGSMNLQDIMYATSTPVVLYCFNDGFRITNV